MTETLITVITAGFLLIGAFLCVAASIGLLRFPDLFSRMHAAAKPQVLGLLLILIAVALELRAPESLPTLILVMLFQAATIPVSTHMLTRAAYRSGALREDTLLVNERIPDIDEPPPGGSLPVDPPSAEPPPNPT